MRVLILLVVWMSAMSVAGAQPAGSAAQPDAQAQRREKIKQRIRALRAYTLTEQLQLDEATAAKLFPALAKYDDEFDKLLTARADIQKRLDGAGSLKDAKAVDKLIDEAVANQKAIWDTEAKRLEQLRKILTPAQVARTLIVLPAMERKIQNQLRKVVQKKKGARRGGGADDDDELGSNPFAGKGDDDFDKGNSDLLPPKGTKKAAPQNQKPACDPFGSVHGCSK